MEWIYQSLVTQTREDWKNELFHHNPNDPTEKFKYYAVGDMVRYDSEDQGMELFGQVMKIGSTGSLTLRPFKRGQNARHLSTAQLSPTTRTTRISTSTQVVRAIVLSYNDYVSLGLTDSNIFYVK